MPATIALHEAAAKQVTQACSDAAKSTPPAVVLKLVPVDVVLVDVPVEVLVNGPWLCWQSAWQVACVPGDWCASASHMQMCMQACRAVAFVVASIVAELLPHATTRPSQRSFIAKTVTSPVAKAERDDVQCLAPGYRRAW